MITKAQQTRGKKPKKKVKKINLTKKADKVWADSVKEKAGYRCEVCGKVEGLNSHHIFSRSNYTVRHDINNGICLCVAHHVFGNWSAHKSPVEFVEWIKDNRGINWYEELRAKARMTIKDLP
jgi:hypothetical protein